MNNYIFEQIFQTINLGVIVIDKGFLVCYWNRWLEINTKVKSEDIIGSSLFDYFPSLNDQKFIRMCRTVFSFGSHNFISQKLHKYLLPIKSSANFCNEFEFMQQSSAIFPIRQNSEIKYACICINDVTEMVAYEKKLMSLATKDPLTTLYNRRFLYETLEKELKRCRRFKESLSVIMLDIDFFKKINDNYGHLAGDYVLKSVGFIILQNIRGIDIAARYGGEEFCCILPETDIKGAYILAQRIRKAVEENIFIYNDLEIHVTLSAGISEADFDEVKSEEDIYNRDIVLKKADDALFEAKNNGRNRVACFDLAFNQCEQKILSSAGF